MSFGILDERKVMQTLIEAASQISQEIERTRQRLANLEQALEGLRPLISFESSATVLPFVKSSPIQTVEDVFVVMQVEPDVAAAQPKTTAKAKSPKAKPKKNVKSVAVVPKQIEPEKTKNPRKALVKTGPKAKPPKIGASAKGEVKPTKSAKPAKPTKPVEIPSTGGKFWLNCLGRRKLTTAELIDTAVVKLGLDESSRAVIANRARAWLNASAKAGVVVSNGERNGLKVFGKAVSQ